MAWPGSAHESLVSLQPEVDVLGKPDGRIFDDQPRHEVPDAQFNHARLVLDGFAIWFHDRIEAILVALGADDEGDFRVVVGDVVLEDSFSAGIVNSFDFVAFDEIELVFANTISVEQNIFREGPLVRAVIEPSIKSLDHHLTHIRDILDPVSFVSSCHDEISACLFPAGL